MIGCYVSIVLAKFSTRKSRPRFHPTSQRKLPWQGAFQTTRHFHKPSLFNWLSDFGGDQCGDQKMENLSRWRPKGPKSYPVKVQVMGVFSGPLRTKGRRRVGNSFLERFAMFRSQYLVKFKCHFSWHGRIMVRSWSDRPRIGNDVWSVFGNVLWHVAVAVSFFVAVAVFGEVGGWHLLLRAL